MQIIFSYDRQEEKEKERKKETIKKIQQITKVQIDSRKTCMFTRATTYNIIDRTYHDDGAR